MDLYSGYINQLIEQFAKLPGVGNKSAQRLALHIINMPKEHVERFAKIMVDAKNNIHYCKYSTHLRMKRYALSAPIPREIILRLW